MIYISFYYYVFIAVLLIIYYVLPLKFRWTVLLTGSLLFFYQLSQRGFWLFCAMIFVTYSTGIIMESIRHVKKKKFFLWASLTVTVLPLIVTKNGDFVLETLLNRTTYPWIIPIGLSFYTLQMVSYLVDIYGGKITPQKNLGKYALFVSFFPQIVQGPIPRYEQLEHQLYKGNLFDEVGFSKGLQMVVWGFFLKLMIADKAGIVVDTVFGNWEAYQGGYIWVAGILYSIQLYTDFLSCVCISKGVSQLFGIHLTDNFKHPYLSQSVREFWGRWHISLSTWLKDYVYIPLGGNRKGKVRKYINLMITFTVSGIWHGAGYKYIFWGWIHGAYQIIGEMTEKLQNRFYQLTGMTKGRRVRVSFRRLITFLLVMWAWIVFRADSLRQGILMLRNMFTVYNPWIFFDDSLFDLGLPMKEWCVLAVSVFIMVKVSVLQERICIRDKILAQPLWIRWGIYVTAIVIIIVFGTYGYGFETGDFIYGGF